MHQLYRCYLLYAKSWKVVLLPGLSLMGTASETFFLLVKEGLWRLTWHSHWIIDSDWL